MNCILNNKWPTASNNGVIMRTLKLFILCAAIMAFSNNLYAVTQVRATDLTSDQVSEILASQNQIYIVEFRNGDQIPINFEAEGDLFDSKNCLRYF